MIAAAQAAAMRDNLALAVDELTRAAAAGADPKAVKKLESTLGKQVGKQIAQAKKAKDMTGETEAKALAARLKALRSAKKASPRR